MGRYVVGVSGASGIVLALRLVQILTHLEHKVEFTMSKHAIYSASFEMGIAFTTASKFISHVERKDLISIHRDQDIGCAIASGSFETDGMVVIPCSMATLAAIASGLSDNALRRAADVTLKEKRPLILIPRETPLSEIHLENMLKLSRLGATIIPPIPAWYTAPKSLEDIENFIVGKVLDALKIKHQLYPRWQPQQ